jgi:hypothetical protein
MGELTLISFDYAVKFMLRGKFDRKRKSMFFSACKN